MGTVVSCVSGDNVDSLSATGERHKRKLMVRQRSGTQVIKNWKDW